MAKQLVKVNAKQLQLRYGQLLQQPPWNTYGSAYILHKELQARKPPIDVSHQAVRTWWQKYRISNQVSPGLLAGYTRNRYNLYPRGFIGKWTGAKAGAAPIVGLYDLLQKQV
jgi:hypothetical protein